jgi:peptidoglycan hydrolase-like protein with peptidoglycan-binding domain
MEVSSMKGRLLGKLGPAALAVALAAGLGSMSAPPAAANAASPAVAATVMPYATTAATQQAWPVLQQGSNSAWPKVTVRSLQYLLNAHGARLSVDGIFGPKTKAAVVAFQHANGLPSSGVVQAPTWRSLLITAQRGSTGSAVRAVQDQINFRNLKDGRTLVVDGIFGPRTDASVRAFQKAMASQVAGFRVDGIVGPQTWQALISEALSG